jgi:glycosyltransferase involved in cell wall biosynthesis
MLWWGRSDRDYSRNRIVLKLFSALNWDITFFHPRESRTGWLQAYFHGLQKPDLIWVPCFRHNDIPSAARWAQKWMVPLVADPFISAFEKEMLEKRKWAPDSKRALQKRRWETHLLAKPDVVIADTPAHAAFFRDELQVPPKKLFVLYLGAETDWFPCMPPPPPKPPFEVLFYGSYLQLQGVDVIVEAAKKTSDLNLDWVLLGDGGLRPEIEKRAHGLTHVSFEPWLAYQKLAERMAKAHILLGVFGTTLKADLVIPNKVYQSMAVGRPVITRTAKAYQETIGASDIVGWVAPGDPSALAQRVRAWVGEPEKMALCGCATRKLYDAHFNFQKLKMMLQQIIDFVEDISN